MASPDPGAGARDGELNPARRPGSEAHPTTKGQDRGPGVLPYSENARIKRVLTGAAKIEHERAADRGGGTEDRHAQGVEARWSHEAAAVEDAAGHVRHEEGRGGGRCADDRGPVGSYDVARPGALSESVGEAPSGGDG